MFRNYLKVALRRFKRGGTHAVVNVVGLALGMATCSLLFLMIHHEWSYDRFHENLADIHRVYLEYVSPDGDAGYQAMMRPGFTQEIKTTFPGIEHATTFVASDRDFQIGDEMSRHRLAEIDADFFDIFTFPTLAGDPVAAIGNPSSMVITAEAATIMFGVGDGTWHEALGRSDTIPNDEATYDFSVGAVLAPIRNNSSITFDVAISFENYDNIYVGGNNWGGRTSTYITLADGSDRALLEAAFPPFTDAVLGDYVQGMRDAERISTADRSYALRLQPLVAMHQDMDVWVPYETRAHNPMYSWILSGIGVLILLIACINFMTLSVGQSTIRAREVGVRKVLGANRTQIMRQHWGESVVLAGVSLAIGLGIAMALLPGFNSLVGSNLSIADVSPVLVLMAIVLLVIVVGVAAGSYPAVVLSAFRPAHRHRS
jgi:putative ABC transport system permease protein